MLTKIEKKPLPDYIAAVVLLLMATGAVFVFSAGANLSYQLNLQKFYEDPRLRQLIFFPLATLIIFTVSAFNYKHLTLKDSWLKSPPLYLLILAVTLLTLVLIPGIGVEKNYARRWLQIHPGPLYISFQPSELAKWTLIIFLTAFACKYRNTIHLYWKRFVPICFIIALIVALIITEDFGTAAFIMLISFLLLLIAGVKFWHLLTLLPVGICAFAIALLNSPHRLKRIAAFLNPQKWADSAAYQANQSLIALGSGGIWGKGLGDGISKYGHLPEDTTDFIFAIIGEELGFIGTLSVILLFVIFIWLGILVVIRCRDRFGQLLAAGIVLSIAIQAAINIGVVTVVLPTKGIPLPFVSSGGTSLILSSIAVGILLNIARQSPKSGIEKPLQSQQSRHSNYPEQPNENLNTQTSHSPQQSRQTERFSQIHQKWHLDRSEDSEVADND